MGTPVTNRGATTRHDRAALGVIATYLHELTDHGRPRERDEDAERERQEQLADESLDDRLLPAAA